MLRKSLQKVMMIGSLLVLGSGTGQAQKPLNDLTSHVRRAVAIVTVYDEQGNVVVQGSGFLIAPDRIVTNLHLIDAAHEIRIKTFSGTTISVRSVVARHRDADVAIMQIRRPARDVTPLRVGKISNAGVDVIVNDTGKSPWNVSIDQADGDWGFEHLATRLQITASLAQSSNGQPIIKLRGHVNGTALSIPR